jgi:hypothetical protein
MTNFLNYYYFFWCVFGESSFFSYYNKYQKLFSPFLFLLKLASFDKMPFLVKEKYLQKNSFHIFFLDFPSFIAYLGLRFFFYFRSCLIKYSSRFRSAEFWLALIHKMLFQLWDQKHQTSFGKLTFHVSSLNPFLL